MANNPIPIISYDAETLQIKLDIAASGIAEAQERYTQFTALR